MNQENMVQSEKKNKKYSKRVVFVFIFGVAVLIFAIALQADFQKNQTGDRGRDAPIRPGDHNQFVGFLLNLQRQANQRVLPDPVVEDVPLPELPAFSPPLPPPGPNVVQANVVPRERRPRQRYYSNTNNASAAAMLREMKTSAILGRPEVQDFTRNRSVQTASETQQQAPQGQDMMVRAASDVPPIDFSTALAALQGGAGGVPVDPGGVMQKENFMYGGGGGGSRTPQGYSTSVPLPQQFRWELKAGTVIPAILMNGIDSSLPGMIRAQVSENIWDTANGSHVLIPKGTMILGVYNSDVKFGDKRIMMIWNRLVFPNGMTLNIAGSPGVDQAGYSGLSGRVNEHWDKMFMAALISSVFIAGAEIVYTDNRTTVGSSNEQKSPQDAAAESLATEMLRVGTRVMDRAAQIPPTIRIRPGRRMAMFVQEDIVFPFPYPMNY